MYNKLTCMNNLTFSIIKPTAFRDGNSGKILTMILDAGFRIIAMKLTHITQQEASLFYNIHQDKVFFKSLTEYMSSGPVIVMILEKENAVEDFRQLIGSTDPEKAAEGSIRKLFGKSISYNAVHGSDIDENAVLESDFFFSKTERF